MKPKTLTNLLPLLAIVLCVGFFYQRQQSHRGVAMSTAWRVVKVNDGDTLTVRSEAGQKDKIRLCGIDAPELAQPLGRESKENLQRLVDAAGGEVLVTEVERDRYGRIVGEVFVSAPTPQQPEQEKFLNGEQVLAGMAYVYDRYVGQCPNGDVLRSVEGRAKQQRVGVWRGANVKPWDYRRAKR